MTRGSRLALLHAGAVLAFAALGPGVRAADAPPPSVPARAPTAAEAADAALAARRRKDAKAFETIARSESPDAWSVADMLLFRGEREAALAIAKAAPGLDAASLPAYLASRPTPPDDVRRRADADAILALFHSKRHDEALAAAAKYPDEPKDVGWIRVRHTVGLVLERPGSRAQAIETYLSTADVAEALGWLRRVHTLLLRAGTVARDDGDLATAEAAWTRMLALDERRKDAKDVAQSNLNLGAVHAQQGKHALAVPELEAARRGADAVGNSIDAAIASKNLGMVLRRLHRLREAEAALRRAVADYERLGRDDQLAAALTELGWVAHDIGDGPLALESFERGLRLQDGKPESAALRRTRRGLAATRNLRGENEEARRLTESLIADAEARGELVEAAELVPNLALILDGLGKPDEARALRVRALETARSLGNRRMEGTALSRLGDDDARHGRVDEAVPMLRAAVEIQEEIGATVDLAFTEHHLGSALLRRGQTADAIRHLERAQTLAEATGQRRVVARAQDTLGNLLHELGELERAEACLAAALAIDVALHAEREAAGVRVSLGIVKYERGDMAGAIEAYLAALESVRTLRDSAGMAAAFYNLATMASGIGDSEQAITYYRDAERHFAAAGDAAGVSHARAGIASKLGDQGRWAEAAELLEALRTEEETRGDPTALSHVLHLLAIAKSRLGDPEAAERLLRRGIAIREGIRDHLGLAASRTALGWVLVEQGRAEDAATLLRRAIADAHAIGAGDRERRAHETLAAAQRRLGHPKDAVASLRTAVALAWRSWGGLSDDETAVALGQNSPTAVGSDAAIEANDTASLLFFLEAGRAGSLLSSRGAREALVEAARPRDVENAEAKVRAAEVQAGNDVRRALDAADPTGYEAAKARLDEARKERDTLSASWTRRAKASTVLPTPTDPDVAALARVLRPEEALVLFGVRSKTAVAVLVRQSGARWLPLGPAADVRAAVRAAIERRDEPDTFAKLSSLLVAPLALDATVRRVLVSPEGALARIPWSLLVGDRSVVLVPSIAILRDLRARSSAKGDGVLALGDPAYGEPSRRQEPIAMLRAPQVRLLPLPGTREEVRRVGTEVFLGKDASETTLRTSVPRRAWRSIHLACHGVFDDATGWSALALSPSSTDDGFVTVPDVLRLPVRSDLVVLSACESALGIAVESEGIQGIPRAFLVAGATRVLSSLWKVNDEATAALMQKFYERWNAGVPASDALREAQAAVRSNRPAWKDPKHWASWVLWGAD